MAIRPLAASLHLCILSGIFLAGPALAAPKVAVGLISESSAIEPGGMLWVGLRQRIAPGWHTYWLQAANGL